MNSEPDLYNSQLEPELEVLHETIWALAKKCEGDYRLLLSLLRTLELLHREIREQIFEPSLPNNRKDLYDLIREIEETGGWPYIERMRLVGLLRNLQSAAAANLPADPPENDDISS